MNIKKLTTAFLAAVLLGTPMVALADTSTANSEGRIRFIADPEGGGIFEIHHPDNSDDTTTDQPLWITPLPPTEAGGEAGGMGSAGSLRINFAPHLYFGVQAISDVDQVYQAYFLRAGESQRLLQPGDAGYVAGDDTWVAHRTPTVTGNRIGEDIPHFIQVTDARGTMGGWSLTVANTVFSAARSADFMGSQFDLFFPDETGNRHVLAGATLTFSQAVHNTYANNAATDVGVHATNIVLDGTGAARNVMAAEPGSGAGIHQTVWGTQADANANDKNASIELFVPGTTTQLGEVDYTTTLTWSLTDVPGNNVSALPAVPPLKP